LPMAMATVTRRLSRGRQPGWQLCLWLRCAKRHVRPHDAPWRPLAGRQHHVASRLPIRHGRPAAHVKLPPIQRPSWKAANCCAAMVETRGALTGWTPSAASHPPPRHGTRQLVTGRRRSDARGADISRFAPPVARPRRHPSVQIHRDRSTVTAATTPFARAAARRWPRQRFNSSSR
jgi:hypothetical protein